MKSDLEFRYVPHAQVPAYEAAGWTNTGDSQGHHGEYSSIMYRYVDAIDTSGKRVDESVDSEISGAGGCAHNPPK
jgi:hypothetical protein